MKIKSHEICARLAEVRQQHFGQRGKARFAKILGIRPSTYHHYELDRTPPAELLVRAAEVTGTSLEWLLTGEHELTGSSVEDAWDSFRTLMGRLRELLQRKPELQRSIAGFLDLLEEVAATFPDAGASNVGGRWQTNDLIPVVGGTAAGPAHYWRELEATIGQPEIDARLDELLEQQSARAVRQAELHSSPSEAQPSGPVSLVQLSRPDELGFVEFLSNSAIKTVYPQAVAWRIDGDSMSPRFRDGDFVMTSPNQPAVDGHPCVARQKDQIGVNCKIYHRDGDAVMLIPVNESFLPQRVDAADVLWAYRVLYSVRLTETL